MERRAPTVVQILVIATLSPTHNRRSQRQLGTSTVSAQRVGCARRARSASGSVSTRICGAGGSLVTAPKRSRFVSNGSTLFIALALAAMCRLVDNLKAIGMVVALVVIGSNGWSQKATSQ